MDIKKPPYYDGSGKVRIPDKSAYKETVISPQGQMVPKISNVEDKPSYYDGSGTMNLSKSPN